MNILSKLRGQHVALAGQTLPDCATAKDTFREAEVDVPELGKVFILFKRFRSKHGKSITWFWAAQAAAQASDVFRER